MNELTRYQAIQRIIDIRSGLSVDHLNLDQGRKAVNGNVATRAACNELKEIFDVSEEEITDRVASISC